jgi:hypothetical protein
VRESHFMDPPCVYIEIRQSSLKALKGETGLELPLERAPAGGLTKACREKLTISLQGFLKKDVWQPRFRAYCAIGARGVSLRRLTLPATSKERPQATPRAADRERIPAAARRLGLGLPPNQ